MEVRIDKFLWAIRAFKTRTEAADACKGGKVKVNGGDIKPAREVKIGDTITIRKGAVLFTYQVKELLDKRVGAALVENYVDNLTPQAEIDKMRAPVETFFLKRERGTGRPTKKERRSLDQLMDSLEYSYDD